MVSKKKNNTKTSSATTTKKATAPKKAASSSKAVAAKKTAAPKKVAAKSVAPTAKEEDASRVYHVVKRPSDNKWAVKFANGSKVIKLFDTQKEAIEYTKAMADRQEGAMLVHNSKGKNKGRIKSK